MWRLGVVVITTAQPHSTKLELRFCACSVQVQTLLAACRRFGNKAKRLSTVNHSAKAIHH